MKKVYFVLKLFFYIFVFSSCTSADKVDSYPEIPFKPSSSTLLVPSRSSAGPYLAATSIEYVHND